MSILGITIYGNMAVAAGFEKERGNLTLTSIIQGMNLAELLSNNTNLKKNGFKSVVISFSDEFVHFFSHSFKDASENEAEKLVKLKLGSLLPFDPKEANIGLVSRRKGSSLETFSAVIDAKMVKESEELMRSRGFRNITSVPASIPFLNLCENNDFTAACGFGGIVTMYFISDGMIAYCRKLKANNPNELEQTLSFYGNIKKGKVHGTMTVFGDVNLKGAGIKADTFDTSRLFSAVGQAKESSLLSQAVPSAGAVLCV